VTIKCVSEALALESVVIKALADGMTSE